MQRSLVFALLAVSAGCATEDSTRHTPSKEAFRVVSQVDLPLVRANPSSEAQKGGKSFQAGSVSGSLEDDGTWTIRAEVTHRRLRCATYATGIRLGVGDASCSKVEWLTGIENGTRETQCNGATRIHSGGGTMGQPPQAIESANCVRVLVRCSGRGC
jgi:hypothetical protein